MKISIISTVYNKEKFLKNHIESLLNQTYKDIEFVFVNDGSTDKSFNILKEYKDNRITIIDQKNQGVSTARKNGFKKSNGDIVWFVDSDDTLHSNNTVKNIVDIFLSNKNIDFIIANMVNVYNTNSQIDKIIFEKNIKDGKYDVSYLYDKIFRGSLCCKFIKRERIKDEFFINSKNYEDMYFSYNLLINCKKFYYTEEIAYDVNRKKENNNRATLSFDVLNYFNKYNIIYSLMEDERFKKYSISLNKLYFKTYLDDLNSSTKFKNKKEFLYNLNNNAKYDLNINIFSKGELSSHYIRLYNYRNFFKNVYTNKLISLNVKLINNLKGVLRKLR